MSTADNKQLIQHLFAEMAKRNAEAVLGAIADDVRFTLIGTTKYSGTYHGKAEWTSKVLEPVFSQIEGEITLTLENLIAEGDYVVLQARAKTTTKAGIPYNNTYCHVFRIANNKVQEWTEYLDTEMVTAAFGK